MTPSTSDPAAPPAGSSSRRTATCPNWLREPLLHFVVLGSLLFAVDHAIVRRADDPHRIVVGAAVDDEARALFKASRGREPDANELAALRRVWLDNEVLYREGLALQVDKGDSAIRERVIFKALSVVDANVKRPAADERALRAWFESNRARYDEPARYDFREAVLSGDTSEAAVRGFVATLNKGMPGDLDAGLRVFKGRPRANLVDSYGAAFVQALDEAAPGAWRALRTCAGWRAVRLEAVAPARPAVFEALRGVVLHDWIDAVMAERRTAAVRALGRKYRVTFETAAAR